MIEMPLFDRTGPLGLGPMTGRGMGLCVPSGGYVPRFPRAAIYGSGTGNDAEGRGSEGNENGGRGVSYPNDPLAVLLLMPLYAANTVLGTLARGSGVLGGPRRFDANLGPLPTGQFGTVRLNDMNFY